MIESEKIQEFEESLGDFLAKGDSQILDWFLELSLKYNANLLASDTIIKNIGDAVVNLAPQNKNIFDKIITSSPEKNHKKISKMFSEIINKETPDQSTTLLKAFMEKHKDWPDKITKDIEEKLMITALEVDYPKNVPMFETIISIVSGTVYNKLQPIADTIISWISEGDINMSNEGIRLLELINKKATPIEPFGVQAAIERTVKLSEENNVEFTNVLLNFVFSNSEQLSSVHYKQIADILKNLLIKEKQEPMRNIGFNFAPKLIEKDRRYGMLKHVLELAASAKEPNTQNQCKNLIKNFKRELSYKEEETAKEVFGDTILDEEDKS